MIDLWPQDLQADERQRAPVTILKEQASLLGQKTRNLLEAEVRQRAARQGFSLDVFFFDFYLVAPALGHYRFKLFSAWHDIRFYPLFVQLDEDLEREVCHKGEREVRVDSEEEFLQILRKIFASQKTRGVIQALLAQVA